jgi:hypothetical protein
MSGELRRFGLGFYLAGEADGAIPNGRRVVKVDSEPGDGTPLGTEGRVLSSIRDEQVAPNVFYFVEWDSLPGTAVGVIDWKLREAVL